ncbi:MAG: hypothetical protein QMD46_01890 [Methanomicrobiales archaeon]|nr:hypothetical protein [Methanomicrobiales archaeon]
MALGPLLGIVIEAPRQRRILHSDHQVSRKRRTRKIQDETDSTPVPPRTPQAESLSGDLPKLVHPGPELPDLDRVHYVTDTKAIPAKKTEYLI